MTKGITRARIVTAALELLDEKGIDAVTVRALATALGVKPPALYYHVRDKQELLDEMSTEIYRRVATGLAAMTPHAHWRDDLAGFARLLRAEFLLHRDGARTFSGTRITDPGVPRAQEPWLARWAAAGHSLPAIMDALDLVSAFVVGFVIEEQEQRQGGPERYSLPQRDEWLGDDAPLVRQSGHARDHGDPRFERHLGILLDGIAGDS
ncbi:TetR/AcrR family transcriptional regulator C-terminal domain-containing protein [Catenuloplanes japonicus]|uniref:TetR/AcrR family transcriptional regulator C-terminal domain-containing protein n=1 Tax=Catenuloplanes japonicus TaxID=33876 RepID=UPI000527782C|nr:TetR/AcrR family transcriptional regulator C-terminal domain-containing protein [Catenuloplanes japonicus]